MKNNESYQYHQKTFLSSPIYIIIPPSLTHTPQKSIRGNCRKKSGLEMRL